MSWRHVTAKAAAGEANNRERPHVHSRPSYEYDDLVRHQQPAIRSLISGTIYSCHYEGTQNTTVDTSNKEETTQDSLAAHQHHKESHHQSYHQRHGHSYQQNQYNQKLHQAEESPKVVGQGGEVGTCACTATLPRLPCSRDSRGRRTSQSPHRPGADSSSLDSCDNSTRRIGGTTDHSACTRT